MPGTVSLTVSGTPYTQNFDTLVNTAGTTTNAFTLNGWFLDETGGGARDNEQYAVDTGGSNTGDTYSYGSTGATDRALGALRSGTLIPNFGANFVNNTGGTITTLDIAYRGEQWRLGTAARSDTLTFQISYNATGITDNAATWNTVAALGFTSPFTTTVGARDGNAAGNFTDLSASLTGLAILSGQNFWVRWVDGDASSSDDGLAIDNFSLTATSVAPPASNISISPTAITLAEGSTGTTAYNYTLTRSNTMNDTGISVTITGGTSFNAADVASVTIDGVPVAGFALGTAFTVPFTGSTTTAAVVINVVGDTVVEASEAFTVTLTAPTGGYALGTATATGTVANDDVGITPIYLIQGSGLTSALVGQTVTTRGVVTAVDTNGFFMQDATGDGEISTSDGIFVFTSTVPPAAVVVGNLIDVTATVAEFVGGTGSASLTQLTTPTVVLVSPGNPLPAPVLISTDGTGRAPPTQAINPGGIAFWESLEGMRVTIQAPLVVANTNGFGETYVVASGGVGATGVNDRGGITISSGDFNPEKIQIDDDSGIFAGYTPGHSQSDLLADVTGILNYAFAEYEIIVTEAVTVTQDNTLTRETTSLVGDAGQFSYASFNVENLDPTDPALKFMQHALEIVQGLLSPDIIGVQEIQDADGAGSGSNLSGALTAQLLIDAVAALGGPTYRYVEIAPTTANTTGGEPGGNIRNGFFYNPARVTYVEGSAALIDTAPYATSRRPLVADFMFNGERFTSINLHSTSRGGSDPLWGAAQPPADAGDSARTAQAAGVRSYIDAALAVDPARKFVVNGDFNGFYFESALTNLTTGGVLANLYDLLPVEERYSYIFQGNYQTLDHIFVSGSLVATSAFDVVHYNAFVADNAALRATDHDQPIATIGQARTTGTAVAIADNFATTEAAFYRGTVLANDSGGGAGLVVATVNGIAPGTAQTLASGARLTLLADGTFTYDPDGAFNALNTGATTNDSFSYTLPGGATATASILITGITAATPGAGNDVVTGTPADDSFTLSGGGNDTASGGAGNDAFAFGAAFTALDRVNGGSGANDQVGLSGNYAAGLVLNADTITNVEVLAVLPGFSYNITSHDGNVAAGQMLSVFGGNLLGGQNFTFNGSAETDGQFRMFGGLGNDTFTGGAQDDGFYFGPGKWGVGDAVVGGAGTNDQLGLDGSYTTMIGATADVEVVVLLGGPVGNANTFNITVSDAFTPDAETRTVFGTSVTTALIVDGSAETDGNLIIYGGRAADTLTGGAGNDLIFGNTGGDTLRGGAGLDTFLYDDAGQSTGVNYDRLLDFSFDDDLIRIAGQTHDSYSLVGTGTLSTASFDADLAAALNAQLTGGRAVFFTPNAGTLAGSAFLVVDANGVDGYQSGQDYVFEVPNPPPALPPADFIIP